MPDDILIENLVEALWPAVERKLERELTVWRWATPEQLAEKLGIGAAAVRERIRQGTLPAQKWEGRWYIDMREIDGRIRQAR